MLFCVEISIFLYLFFFFKQKTAYEMRISDWSSDVCSSDLEPGDRIAGPGIGAITDDQQIGGEARDSIERGRQRGAECVTRGALRQRQVERGAVAGALAVLVGMAPVERIIGRRKIGRAHV